MIKKLFITIALLLLLWPSLGWAAIYYVDTTTGDDEDTGLSEALAWQTITHVNAASFNADDQILFKCGETWTLQGGLEPPSSGTSGHPIIFGSYGEGAKPIINASTSGDEALLLSGGISYVTVQDIDFTCTQSHVVFFGNASYCIVDNIEAHGSTVGAGIAGNDGAGENHHNTVKNSNAYGQTWEGIYFCNITADNLTHDITIENNESHDNGYECVQMTFHGSGTIGPAGSIVSGNKLYNCGDTGHIQVQGDVVIEYNELYGTGGSLGGVFVDSNSDGTVIIGNVIHDIAVNSANPIAGIRLADATVTNTLMYNNTIYKVNNAGAGVGRGFTTNASGATNLFKNNIVSECDNQITWNAPGPTADTNVVYGSSDETGTNAITTAPLFTNAAGDDFTLQAGSPCRNAGVYLPGYESKLKWTSTWPDGVLLMDDILSIGAYAVPRGAAGM